MKRFIAILGILGSIMASGVQAEQATSRSGLARPDIGSTGWGRKTNDNWSIVDSSFAVLGTSNTFTQTSSFPQVELRNAGPMTFFGTNNSGLSYIQNTGPGSLMTIISQDGIGINNSPRAGVDLAVYQGNLSNAASFALMGSSRDVSAAYSGFMATGPIDQSVLWALPHRDGTAGQPWITDGNGNLSFGDPLFSSITVTNSFSIANQTPNRFVKTSPSNMLYSGVVEIGDLPANVACLNCSETWSDNQTYTSSVTVDSTLLASSGTVAAQLTVNGVSTSTTAINVLAGNIGFALGNSLVVSPASSFPLGTNYLIHPYYNGFDDQVDFHTPGNARPDAVISLRSLRGWVGIGKTNPGVALDVFGEVKAGSVTVSGLSSGQCVQAGSNGELTSAGAPCGSGGGGSGASTLQVTESGVQKTSPTASMNFFTNDFDLTATGSTTTIILNPNTTNFVHNQATLQDGAFYVGSGTVDATMIIKGVATSTTALDVQAGNIAFPYGNAIVVSPASSFPSGTHYLARAFYNGSDDEVDLHVPGNSRSAPAIAMRSTGGKVGINTTEPTTQLMVNGEVKAGSMTITTLTAGRCVQADSTGGLVSAAAACGIGSSTGDAVLAATQTWTGGNTYKSTTTFGSTSDTGLNTVPYVTINASGTTMPMLVNMYGRSGGTLQSMQGGVTIKQVGTNTAANLVLVSSVTSVQEGAGILEIWVPSRDRNDPGIWYHDSSNGSGGQIRLDATGSNGPNLEITGSSDGTRGWGKWEPFAQAGSGGYRLQIPNSRCYDNSGFHNMALWEPLSKGSIAGMYLNNLDVTSCEATASVANGSTPNPHLVGLSSQTISINWFDNKGKTYGIRGPDNLDATGSFTNRLPSNSQTAGGQVLYQATSNAPRNWEFTVGGSTAQILAFSGTTSAPYWTDNKGTPAGATYSYQYRNASSAMAGGSLSEDVNNGGIVVTTTGGIHLAEIAANGSSYTGFRSSDSLAGSTLWVLPEADGSSGDYLTTAGNVGGTHNLFWSTPVVPNATPGGTSRSVQYNGGVSTLSGSGKLFVSALDNLELQTTAQARFYQADNVSYVGFQAPVSGLAGSTVWSLPLLAGTTGQVLTTGGSGDSHQLFWNTITSLASTQTWTSGQTFVSSATFAGTVSVPSLSTGSLVFVSSSGALSGSNQSGNGVMGNITDSGGPIGATIAQLRVISGNTGRNVGIGATVTTGDANANAIYGTVSGTTGNAYGVHGAASGTGINYGGNFSASGGTTNIGLQVSAGQTIIGGSMTVTQGIYTSSITASTVTLSGNMKFTSKNAILQDPSGTRVLSMPGTNTQFFGTGSGPSSPGGTDSFNVCNSPGCMGNFNNASANFNYCDGPHCMGSGVGTGSRNACIGYACQDALTGGTSNTCAGAGCLGAITAVGDNVCMGDLCLNSATTNGILALGTQAGRYSTSGARNSFLGTRAGASSVTASTRTITQNGITLVGYEATVGSITINEATAIGDGAIVTSSDTVAIRAGILSLVQSTQPVVTSCGTGATITGSNSAFTITVGSVVTACTLTFSQNFPTLPTCVVSERTASIVNPLSYTVGLTGMTFSQTGLASNVLDVVCIGNR